MKGWYTQHNGSVPSYHYQGTIGRVNQLEETNLILVQLRSKCRSLSGAWQDEQILVLTTFPVRYAYDQL
jgi:hypothetical protein